MLQNWKLSRMNRLTMTRWNIWHCLKSRIRTWWIPVIRNFMSGRIINVLFLVFCVFWGGLRVIGGWVAVRAAQAFLLGGGGGRGAGHLVSFKSEYQMGRQTHELRRNRRQHIDTTPGPVQYTYITFVKYTTVKIISKSPVRKWNEMNRTLGHLCTHIG